MEQDYKTNQGITYWYMECPTCHKTTFRNAKNAIESVTKCLFTIKPVKILKTNFGKMITTMTKLIRITSNYFCAGAIIKNNKITRIAPIIKYMKGWNYSKIFEYCQSKHWTLELL